MLETEARRLKNDPCPIRVGSLWYDEILEVMWQVLKVRLGDEPADSVFELSGWIPACGTWHFVKRRYTMPELVTQLHFFGHVQDTTWEGES